MQKENIFMLLGLNEKVPIENVRKAFIKFAKRNHPDFYPGDKFKEARFKQVTCEYQNWKHILNTVTEIKRIKNKSIGRYSVDHKKSSGIDCIA